MKKTVSLILCLLIAVSAVSVVSYAQSVMLGDVTGDGKLNNKDVVTLFRSVSGDSVECVAEACDVNGDGKVNNKDVVALFKHVSSGTVPGTGNDPSSGLPERDYGGYTVKILTNEDGAAEKDIFGDGSGSDLDKAIRRRTELVKKESNIRFEIKKSENALNDLRVKWASGEPAYDLVQMNAMDLCTAASNGYLANLRNIPFIETYEPCWDQGQIRTFSIKNKLFCITGELSVAANDDTYLMAYNSDLFAEYNLGDPLERMKNGQLTLDYLYEVDAQLKYDLNSNGAFDEYDRYGTGAGIEGLVSLFFGAGGFIAKNNSSDVPAFDMRALKIDTAYKIKDMYDAGMLYGDANSLGSAFINGQIAVYIATAKDAAEALQYVEFGAGLLPLPKGAEDQESYLSYVSRDAYLYAVPSTVRNSGNEEKAGYALTSLCRLSHEIVTPEYRKTFDIRLTGVLSIVDPDALEVIFTSRAWDLVYHGLYSDLEEDALGFSGGQPDLGSLLSVFNKIQKLVKNYVSAIDANTD